MLEHPNVPRTTNQITPTPETPNISDNCPMSADPTTNDDSISSNIDKEWSNSISLNKMLPFEPGPILLDTRNPTEKSKIIDPHIIRKMHPARMLLRPSTGRHWRQLWCNKRHIHYMVLQDPFPTYTNHNLQ
jgi:hypothetical protein